MAIENISQDVADLLATKDFDVKYTDGQGQDASPEESKTFAFDWVAGSGKNYGTVVIVIGDDNDLQLFFGDNLGKTMENPQDKLDWFGSERETGFLPELKNFATQHRYTFSPKDINQLKHTMQGMAAIKEGLFEGYYGTRKISYVGEQTEARLVIKHNRMIGEDDKRYRYVESLFIETVDGERFKLPFVKLSGGRAMLEHVKQGGRPYDIRGQHINEIVSEMAVLSRFNRASQQRVFEGITQELVETVQHYYSELRGNLQHMATGRGYNQYFESWTPADIGDETALVEDLKTMFIEQTLDARIEAALPTLAKIQQRGNAMKEAQIFENWANSIMEGTWALPDTPEAQAKLDELMSKELIVGPDATNATEQLYDVIGDDKLFDILGDLAEQDPRANCWDDTDVQARLQELGIQMNTTPDAEQQQPVAPAAGEQAPGTAPEQGMAEGEGMLGRSKYDKRYLDKFDPTEVMNISDDPEMKANRTTRQGSLRTSKKDLEFAFGPPGEDDTWVLEFRNGLVATIYPQPNNNFGMDWFIGGNHPDIEDYVLKAYSAAIDNLEEGMAEDQLDELSPATLSSYARKAKGQAGWAAGVATAAPGYKDQLTRGGEVVRQQHIVPGSEADQYDKLAKRRYAGARQAVGKGANVNPGNVEPYDWAKQGGYGDATNPAIRKRGMAENTELNAMLKYAGVPLKESVLTDSTGHTLDHILKRFGREVADFEAGAELDNDLFDALYDYYFDDMPYGVKKARTGDPHEWISDRLAADLGITESNSGMIMPEADPIATVEAMPELSNPVVEGTCNATMEGEYCPEHGLAECGMYEMGTVAGSMAPVMDEGDPNSLTGLAGQAVGYVTPNPSDAVAGFKKQFEDNEIVQNTRKLTDGWKGAVAGGAAGAMAGDLAGGALGSKIGQALGGAAGAAGGPIGSAAGQIAGNMAGEKIGQFVGGALGGAAGGVAGDKLGDKVNEKKDDPINYNGAITGAYYESKSDTALLARIKSLALLR